MVDSQIVERMNHSAARTFDSGASIFVAEWLPRMPVVVAEEKETDVIACIKLVYVILGFGHLCDTPLRQSPGRRLEEPAYL